MVRILDASEFISSLNSYTFYPYFDTSGFKCNCAVCQWSTFLFSFSCQQAILHQLSCLKVAIMWPDGIIINRQDTDRPLIITWKKKVRLSSLAWHVFATSSFLKSPKWFKDYEI